MKFGEKFSEYLETNQERFVENCRDVEYKRLKKVLKRCRSCRAINDSPSSTSADDNGDEAAFSQFCQFESCQSLIWCANPESKCPVYREVIVFAKAVHMMELDLLLKKGCKEYWKERLDADMVKQSKVYWEMQTEYMIGY